MNKIIDKNLRENANQLYDEFITTWANYLNSLSINDIPLLLCYTTRLLYSGLFSVSKFSYHNYKYDQASKLEQLGLRVISGKTVCRHNVKFFEDLFKKMGYKTHYIVGCMDGHRHAVIGIENDMNSYIFDPTNPDFLNPCNTEKDWHTLKYILANLKIKIMYSSNLYDGLFEYSINNYYYIIKYLEQYIDFIIKIRENVEINKFDLNSVLIDSVTLLMKEFNTAVEINTSLSELMQEIVNIDNIISPHSDTKRKIKYISEQI